MMLAIVLAAVLAAPPDPIERAIALTNALRLDEAEAVARDAYRESIACRDLRLRARAADVLGIVARSRGDADLALDLTAEALALGETLGDATLRARAHNDLGRIWFDLFADADRARAEYDRGLALRARVRDGRVIARLLNNLGNVAQSGNDYAAALTAYERARRASERARDREGILAAEHNIGRTLALQNEPARALPYLRHALAIERAIRSPAAARTLLSISEAYRALGRADDALRVLGEARRASTADELTISTILLREGDLRLGRRDFAGAARSFDGSQRIVERLGDAGSLPLVLAYRAKLRLAQRRWSEAASIAADASARAAAAGQLDTFAQARSIAGGALRSMGEAAAARRAFDDAVDAIERERAQVAGGHESRQRFFESEIYPYLQLVELAAEAGDATAALAYSERAKARTLRDAITTMAMARGRPRPQPPGVPPGGQTIEYTFTASKVFAFVETRVVTLPTTPESLALLADRFAAEVASRNLAFRVTARALYDILIRPLALPPTPRLLIVPDRELWRVPFAALIDERDRYLVESAAVAVAPSLAAIAAPRPQRARLFAAGDLPDSAAELQALAAIYPQPELRDRATEGEVKARMGDADVVHIAAHGIFDDANPLQSHVVLRPSRGEDGLLTARELMSMRLEAALVVLSACETASGHIAPGEGIVGMTWALFLAGCPTVVASEWKIESTSAYRLVVAMHREVARGGAPADALRNAQLELMREPRYAHPFYWAAFVVAGRGW